MRWWISISKDKKKIKILNIIIVIYIKYTCKNILHSQCIQIYNEIHYLSNTNNYTLIKLYVNFIIYNIGLFMDLITK